MPYQHYILIEEAYKEQNDSSRHPGASTVRNCVSPSRLTDVSDFFHDIIDEYLQLEKMAVALTVKVHEVTPEELLRNCTVLCQRKRDLSAKDEQLIDILSLAGSELVNTPLIHDYRVAFAKTTMSCNNLYQRLKALQLEILEETLKEFNSN